MSGLRVVMVGELTLDEVVMESAGVRWEEPGGGALYSALGALIWGARPGICATVGTDYPETMDELLTEAGIDISGLTRISQPGLGVRLVYGADGSRHQVPKASGSSFEFVDAARRPWSELGGAEIAGVHVAPQTVEGQVKANLEVQELGTVATLDVMVEPFIEIERYRSGEALRGAHALLLNEHEVFQIWGDRAYPSLRRELTGIAEVRYLIVKQGEGGALLATEDGLVHVPALSDHCVDPTGAGDGFCGGFLVGLLESGDPVEAALCGAVSASLIVEERGPLPVLSRIDEAAVAKRLKDGRRQIRTLA